MKDSEKISNSTDAISFAESKLNIKLDKWQREYIECSGNTHVRAGRQSGKSFAESLRVALFSLLNPKTTTLIIASVEMQATELLEKVQNMIITLGRHQIAGRPTMRQITLKNGSRIIAHATGRTGYSIRGYTIHKLVVDEAHFVPDEVFIAVRPMLATTQGTIDLLSTPKGNKGYFYEAWLDPNYTKFYVKSEDCTRISKTFLQQERKRMTKLQYAQEYEAEFLDALQQFFPIKLVESCMILDDTKDKGSNNYMGVDIARYGGDENAFIVVEMQNKEHVKHIYSKTTNKVSTTDTTGRIINLTKEYSLRKVFIDDGGIGGAVFDYLVEKPELRRKIIGINNATRSITHDKTRSKKLMKEDLYGNLKRMMEQGHIKLLKDENLKQSLLSIQFEYTSEGNVKIFGRYTHLTEALIRAAWCIKSASLNIWAECGKYG